MKFGLALAFIGFGALAAGTFGYFAGGSFATVEFTFPVPSDKGSVTYRCQELETPQKTVENARAAHQFYVPALLESTRKQAELMARSMSPTRPASEIIPELEQIDAVAYAERKKLQREMQSSFGCAYRRST